MKITLQFRHAARHEATVLANTVTAHRRGIGRHVFTEEFDGLLFGLLLVQRALAHALSQTGAAMLAGIPLIHGIQHLVRLVYGQHRTFCKDV